MAESDPRLIVALDVSDVASAEKVVDTLGDRVEFYKIGYQLGYAGGLEFAGQLRAMGKSVFLDLKLLDIDHTIERAVESVLKLNVAMLTVHAYPKAMRAAVQAARGTDLCLLGVTVLTSMDDQDLVEAGYQGSASDLVLKRAAQAKDAGMGGLVASAMEAAGIRSVIGSEMAIVTPGIRPEGAAAGDQKRVMTPAKALAAGASHLVVGRPIVAAADPRKSAEAVIFEMAVINVT